MVLCLLVCITTKLFNFVFLLLFFIFLNAFPFYVFSFFFLLYILPYSLTQVFHSLCPLIFSQLTLYADWNRVGDLWEVMHFVNHPSYQLSIINQFIVNPH